MMQYRPFGSLDFAVSALGFGCMRLPTIDGAIDEEQAIRMLHYAIDHGVNYLDTAYPYHGGQSEPLVGRALQGGYRGAVAGDQVAPTASVNEPDFDRMLNEQLERLQTDRLDVSPAARPEPQAVGDGARHGRAAVAGRPRASGRVGAVGFSFTTRCPRSARSSTPTTGRYARSSTTI